MKKKVIKFKGDVVTEELCESNPLKLAPASKYIEKYIYEIIKDVFNYQMRREAELQEVHKIYEDSRILAGLELYKKGMVIEGAITDVDVRATVKGENNNYLVTLKKWKPLDKFGNPKLIRHRYEIEEYIAGMFFDCGCRDHMIHHYKSNSALACKHISAVMWLLMEKYDMTKFFIKPEEQQYHQKSNNIDLVKNLKCLPMKKFTPHLNVVALREFRNIPTSLSLSIHRTPNKGYEKDYPNGISNVWITITEPSEVEKLIKANIKGYAEMLASRKNTEQQIKEAINNLIPTKNGEIEEEKIEEKPLEKIEKVKKEGWFEKLMDKIKGWFEN